MGASVFVRVQRGESGRGRLARRVRGAYQKHVPGEAKSIGKELLQAAKDFGDAYLFKDPPKDEDDLPKQPSSLRLSAPVDPARRVSVVPKRARMKRTRKGRRLLREVGGGMRTSGEVQSVRQRMDAPVLIEEFEIPFWRTDLGRGIKYTICFALFFGCLGYFLFRNRDPHARSL